MEPETFNGQDGHMGLRELKKTQTRQLIADTAWRLFADRGFDRVTVAEVAREAQVAEATVFNYFQTKEDLFYFRLEAFGTRLIDAIRARPDKEPALAAFRRHLLASQGQLTKAAAGEPEALERLRSVNRVIAASPALRAGEQKALARYADSLAALLAAETGAPADDVQARVAANAMMGIHRALIDYVRHRVLAGEGLDRLASDVNGLAERAFALLGNGLASYARKTPPEPCRAGAKPS